MILLFGPRGQVGWELRRTLSPLGNVVTAGREGADQAVDLTAPRQAGRVIREVRPDLVVNAAAYTAVDQAEDEPDLARRVNTEAPAEMARAAAERDIPLIHYSTDYVFDGTLDRPYTEDDPTTPINVYGTTKRDGEQGVAAAGGPHLILRTSWVYGLRGRNFLRTMLRLAAERDHLDVVDDQVGAPTWSRWIAEATAHIVGTHGRCEEGWRESSGTYHLTAAGVTSWYGFLQAILAASSPPAGWQVETVSPVTTEAFGAKAPRPRNSELEGTRLEERLGVHRPTWEHTLRLCLDEVLDPASMFAQRS
jgi:dTDP-4-dehydrorhamnose reductase